MNEQFKSRLKSFAWRTGMMVLALGASYGMEELKLIEGLNPLYVTLGGLVLGELSKFLNNELSKKK